MENIFLCYPKCTTCQKAKTWLDENHVAYIERHIVEQRPSKEELTTWFAKSGLPLKRFFNTSGLLYKELHVKEKLLVLTESEQLDLLASNGMLVKRPILITKDAVLVGFKELEWKEKL